MLCSIRDLQGYGIEATNGSIGRVHEMLFHDDKWVIRYLVVDTGKWLPGRKVLISPISVESINGPQRRVVLHLDKDRIRNSPDIYADEPVSRWWSAPEPVRTTDDCIAERLGAARELRGGGHGWQVQEERPQDLSDRAIIVHAIPRSNQRLAHRDGDA